MLFYFLNFNFSDLPFLKILLLACFPFLSAFCCSYDNWMTSWHSEEQVFSIFSEQSVHWINNKWHASFAQFTWLSQGLPHWWQLAITSSDIFSALRWSNTKFFPINLFSNPSDFTCLVYSIIPPSNWKTFWNPLCL